MSQVRVHNFAVSLDGFGTGEGQSLDAPFGHADGRLMQWFFATRTFRAMHGEPGGSAGVDDAIASNWGRGIGAEIMGRNKFGPQRGPWADQEWKGWWGDEPPFRTPVFVLTHYRRPPVEMKGGTTFHFIDASPAEALDIAREAADGLDIRIGGRLPEASHWVHHDEAERVTQLLTDFSPPSCEPRTDQGPRRAPGTAAAYPPRRPSRIRIPPTRLA
jgi:dihydrofolate reductase